MGAKRLSKILEDGDIDLYQSNKEVLLLLNNLVLLYLKLCVGFLLTLLFFVAGRKKKREVNGI